MALVAIASQVPGGSTGCSDRLYNARGALSTFATEYCDSYQGKALPFRRNLEALHKGTSMDGDSPDTTIEIRIERISQLFNTFDPLPFRERDLDRDAEEFIVGWARELPKVRRIRIVVHLPAAEAAAASSWDLGTALSRYFAYRAEVTHRELRELFRVGRRSLMIGLIVLAACLVIGGAFDGLIQNEIGKFLREGLVILGWVANWRPIEIFLFDWWAVAQRRTLMKRLADAKVEIFSDERNASA